MTDARHSGSAARKSQRKTTPSSGNGQDVLRAFDLSVHFGGLKAVDAVNFTLKRGEILGLIGPNGAGKTTLVNALTGFQKVVSGQVRLTDKDITGWSPQRRARGGVVRSFQGVRLFPRLTVLENVEAGALGMGTVRADARVRALSLLHDFDLTAYGDKVASALPHGVERRIGVMRALSAEPQFLLLDEPAAGLNERETDELAALLMRIKEQFECALCIVEHDMRFIMNLCERIHVLSWGKTLAVGSPREVRTNEAVVEAYLGRR